MKLRAPAAVRHVQPWCDSSPDSGDQLADRRLCNVLGNGARKFRIVLLLAHPRRRGR